MLDLIVISFFVSAAVYILASKLMHKEAEVNSFLLSLFLVLIAGGLALFLYIKTGPRKLVPAKVDQKQTASSVVVSKPKADTCDNLVIDGEETDLDCGGECRKCPPNFGCTKDSDCTSSSCFRGKCFPKFVIRALGCRIVFYPGLRGVDDWGENEAIRDESSALVYCKDANARCEVDTSYTESFVPCKRSSGKKFTVLWNHAR